MFVEIAKLIENCDLNITLSLREGKLHAIVLPKQKNDKKLDIAPMSLCATPEEYDKEFIQVLSTVVPKVDGFIADMSAMDDQMAKEKSEKAEKAEKKKVQKDDKPKEEKPKEVKINAADEFKKGAELFDAGKYKEAEPHLEAASNAKPDNKTYQQKLNLCKMWIKQMAGAGLLGETTQEKNEEKPVEKIESPFVDNPATTVEEIDEKHNATVAEMNEGQPQFEEEDGLNFSLED